MLKDKDGNSVSLKDVLKYLVGTDDEDNAKSVIDFATYKVKEDKTLGDPEFYLVAAEAIITNVSFLGPFTVVELDFRNINTELINQVVRVVDRFHRDVNEEDCLMVSTLTSLEKGSTHIMSMINPLVCVRGFSIEGNASTLMTLIYETNNVGFSVNNIDVDKITAEIEREVYELESMSVTRESAAAGQADESDANNEMMKEAFVPDFEPMFGGVRGTDERKSNKDGVRISGFGEREKEDTKVEGSKNTRIE